MQLCHDCQGTVVETTPFPKGIAILETHSQQRKGSDHSQIFLTKSKEQKAENSKKDMQVVYHCLQRKALVLYNQGAGYMALHDKGWVEVRQFFLQVNVHCRHCCTPCPRHLRSASKACFRFMSSHSTMFTPVPSCSRIWTCDICQLSFGC